MIDCLYNRELNLGGKFMKKKLIATLAIFSLVVLGAGCTKTTEVTTNSNGEVASNTIEDDVLENAKANIILSDEITVDGSGIIVENNIITIKEGGTYAISGTLTDGQIVVDAGDEDNVEIVLNGANITNTTSSPIYVLNCKNAYIVLNAGTENTITDGSEYVYEDETVDEPNGAIFSKADLFIDGEGTLNVNSNYNDAIVSKDDLEIINGNINIVSVADGIRGKDSVTILAGNLTINASGDGIKSTNATEAKRGYVLIEGGTLNITAGEDGIQGETTTTITGGDINITTGGGSANSSTKSESWGNWAQGSTDTSEEASAKGVKAGVKIAIEGGNINIDSSDDAIHSNGEILISAGTLNLSSGDDGIHADTQIDINGGKIIITQSYEGIESEVININDGDISVVASDDGINVSGGSDSSAVNGRPGQNFESASGDGSLNINGGKVVVDASGDGLDANGSIYMAGGTVIANGPEDNGNGSLDYDGNFEISGGVLIAAGSSGMAQSTSTTSTQNTIGVFLTSTQSANTLVSIKDSNGNEIVTFAPSKTFQSVIISSPDIKEGETYTAYVGGSSKGTETNGLYEGGTYSGGTEVGSVTVSSTVSTIGSGGTQGGMMQPGGGRR